MVASKAVPQFLSQIHSLLISPVFAVWCLWMHLVNIFGNNKKKKKKKKEIIYHGNNLSNIVKYRCYFIKCEEKIYSIIILCMNLNIFLLYLSFILSLHCNNKVSTLPLLTGPWWTWYKKSFVYEVCLPFLISQSGNWTLSHVCLSLLQTIDLFCFFQ